MRMGRGEGDLRALSILRQRAQLDRDAGILFRECADQLPYLLHVRDSRPRPPSPGAMRCRPCGASAPGRIQEGLCRRTPRDVPILMETLLAAVTASAQMLI